ncbi:MAG: UDP-N-acetylmuramoyl-L-alanine--D-glutamate ligase, partial [Defluviitaleaceae bacterium]|nr:UDP-N-acetylmuramoyl-L-alanine--D-glutamate ligase [Defluviitaleaceae bacterium]
KFFTQKNVVVAGNIGVPLTSLVTKLTREDIVVAEISSFQLETIEAFRPVISAVLNIAEDHIDRHLSMENYISAKSRIFENQGQNEISVLNYDDVITRKMNPRAKKIFFGANENLRDGIFIRDEKIFFNDAEIIPVNDTKVLPENALAATAITLAAGVSPQIIAEVLRAFKGVTHRLEFVATIEKVDYYNDSKATNTHAAIKALESFRRPVILIGGGSDKNTDFSPWTKLFYRKVARLLLIGQTADQIAKTCENEKFFAYEKLSSLEAAVLRAKEIAKPGDVVLFSPACASFDMFKNFEERGELFKFYVKGVI